MADVKEQPKPFFTTEKVTLYAPKGAKYHSHQEAVTIQARQKEKFLKFGYTETKEEAFDSEAHPSIAAIPPVAAKPKAVKTVVTKVEEPNPQP